MTRRALRSRQRLDITGTAFDKDIEFWSAAGVISLAGAADEKAPQADLTAKVVPAEPDSAKTKPEPKPETATRRPRESP